MKGADHETPVSDRSSMREVAERAGVSMSSVSRTLSNHPDVSPRMRGVVMEAVRELGYEPDMLAQWLRQRKTFSVGFTVSDIANPILALMVTGAERRLRAAGYSLLVTNSESNPDLDVQHISLLERRRVDGLILALADERHPQTVARLRDVKVPVVIVDRDTPRGVAANAVLFDHRKGMHEALQHLLNLGHREFALIVGGPQRPQRERRSAIERALTRVAGTSCAVLVGEFSVQHGYAAALELVSQEQPPTAVIAGGNMLMHGALLAFREKGVRVGRDISFVGCDDTAVAEVHEPPIAVVTRDVRAIGTAAADLLLNELAARQRREDAQTDGDDEGDTPRAVILPTHFVARPSCGPPPR